jgi:hypothetical protein
MPTIPTKENNVLARSSSFFASMVRVVMMIAWFVGMSDFLGLELQSTLCANGNADSLVVSKSRMLASLLVEKVVWVVSECDAASSSSLDLESVVRL